MCYQSFLYLYYKSWEVLLCLYKVLEKKENNEYIYILKQLRQHIQITPFTKTFTQFTMKWFWFYFERSYFLLTMYMEDWFILHFLIKGKRQLSTFLKIEEWAIGADAVPVLPTGLRGWRTDWADSLALGHPEPGSAASESKKSVKFEPSLTWRRLKGAVFSTDSQCYQ